MFADVLEHLIDPGEMLRQVRLYPIPESLTQWGVPKAARV